MKAEKKMNKKEKEAYIGYGNKLKEFRENMGLTQDDVIDIICMHPNVNYGLATRESISRLECGKRKGILPYRRFEQTLIKIKENKYYEKLQNRNS